MMRGEGKAKGRNVQERLARQISRERKTGERLPEGCVRNPGQATSIREGGRVGEGKEETLFKRR